LFKNYLKSLNLEGTTRVGYMYLRNEN